MLQQALDIGVSLLDKFVQALFELGKTFAQIFDAMSSTVAGDLFDAVIAAVLAAGTLAG